MFRYYLVVPITRRPAETLGTTQVRCIFFRKMLVIKQVLDRRNTGVGQEKTGVGQEKYRSWSGVGQVLVRCMSGVGQLLEKYRTGEIQEKCRTGPVLMLQD